MEWNASISSSVKRLSLFFGSVKQLCADISFRNAAAGYGITPSRASPPKSASEDQDQQDSPAACSIPHIHKFARTKTWEQICPVYQQEEAMQPTTCLVSGMGSLFFELSDDILIMIIFLRFSFQERENGWQTGKLKQE